MGGKLLGIVLGHFRQLSCGWGMVLDLGVHHGVEKPCLVMLAYPAH